MKKRVLPKNGAKTRRNSFPTIKTVSIPHTTYKNKMNHRSKCKPTILTMLYINIEQNLWDFWFSKGFLDITSKA